MVNIHGGGFVGGSGQVSTAATGGFSPNYLLEEDVVFVSFNYRLGAFGDRVFLIIQAVHKRYALSKAFFQPEMT